ncbi:MULTISPECIES: hypothetical protein [Streptomyces]|uniref:Uncharacterized protein n=2 Tax=Streptomyces rimosus subsp. rimosus TaxID=132474 RepID=L8EVJ2_STRR1|nr:MULTISPECIES: hypothetical protein [Streptomyces]MYT44927.1 hypothetical protein [Streptomyces sp. SID5471]KUJ43446.1 hypothetical protein ADK46_00750 [Streptomyces rimosus subsp. rimosus]QDA07206.1 hypothetical protein CTZ40_29105 [Streptomyces rimosus]QEV78485.1 hypothetical protein CP984_29070 [Streptomyces rimosus]QGY70409.1 hypothetical protein V519_035095 [Streptomyces rimosus R6-500]
MSDERERTTEELTARLAVLYIGISKVCEQLPVPITLPPASGTVGGLMGSIDRCYKIAPDQPIPAEQVAALQVACLFWLMAADMIGLYDAEAAGTTIRDEAAQAAMFHTEACISDLMHWLRDA